MSVLHSPQVYIDELQITITVPAPFCGSFEVRPNKIVKIVPTPRSVRAGLHPCNPPGLVVLIQHHPPGAFSAWQGVWHLSYLPGGQAPSSASSLSGVKNCPEQTR